MNRSYFIGSYSRNLYLKYSTLSYDSHKRGPSSQVATPMSPDLLQCSPAGFAHKAERYRLIIVGSYQYEI